MRSHRKTPIKFAVLIFAAMLVRVPLSAAQGIQTSSIVGTVFDSSGAVVPHTEIVVEGTSLIGGPLSTSTDGAGAYAARTLAPGRYSVTARQAGFEEVSRHEIDLPVATTLTVDLVLAPARLVARVDVSESPTPIVDVRSAGAPAHVNQRFLQNLPSLRTLTEIINLAPGVAANVGFGGTQKSNGLYVDGVSINDPRLGGPWLRLNYNWLQEVEVAAIGAGAEYGESTGAIANLVLRSGSNGLAGLAETITTSPGWLARNTNEISAALQRNFAPLQLIRWWDTSGQIGGPIVRDRLWYFAGMQSLTHDYRSAGYSGEGVTHERDDKAIVKVTSALASSLRLEGLVQPGRYLVESGDLGPLVPTEASTDWRQPQLLWNGRLNWGKGRWLLEVRSGGYRSDEHDDPHPPATRLGPASHQDIQTSALTVASQYYFDLERSHYSTSVNATNVVRSRFGEHDLKFGAGQDYATMAQSAGYPGGMLFLDAGSSPYHVLFWNGETLRATNRPSMAFANDTWRIGRVTISLGARLDAHDVSIPQIDSVYTTTAVAPRIGAAWDALGTHRLVFRIHGGRYYDPTPLGRISTLDVSHVNPTIDTLVVAPGQYTEISRTSLVNSVAVDPHVKQAFVDQIIAGTEWQASRGVSLQLNYIDRDFDRFTGMVDVGRRWSHGEARDPGPDGVPGTSDDGGLLTVFNLDQSTSAFFLYANPAGAYRRYRAVQLVGRRSLSRLWEAQASYTWSRATGTVDNAGLTNSGLNDLGTGSGFSDPNRFVNQLGKPPFDPREVKVLSDVVIPRWGGFTIAGVYRHTSGQTWTRRVRVGLTLGSDLVWAEPRGSRRLPDINRLDLRIEKLLPFRRGPRLGVSADVFNVTNQAVPNSDVSGAVQVNSGPTFGQPLAWVDPRLLRINLRVIF